jgi:hypothetical protein
MAGRAGAEAQKTQPFFQISLLFDKGLSWKFQHKLFMQQEKHFVLKILQSWAVGRAADTN